MVISILEMRRGLAAMCLVMLACAPSMSMPRSRAPMPITVRAQLASAVATRSVGEKASPLPWLSTGASVMMLLFEAR